LLDERGAIVTGANVENASYPLGVCAERAAILAWRAAEGARLAAVVIHTETDAPTSPCGLCREALCRWADAAAIYLSCRAGLSGPFRAGHWLPAARHGTRR
jgi:cytidine deaminase